jgi:hypothetical protein
MDHIYVLIEIQMKNSHRLSNIKLLDIIFPMIRQLNKAENAFCWQIKMPLCQFHQTGMVPPKD